MISVVSTGDRPIQVGSHFHFAESNEALAFDRQAAYGMRPEHPGRPRLVEQHQAQRWRSPPSRCSARRLGWNGLVAGPLERPDP